MSHVTAEQIELFVLRAFDQIGDDFEEHLASCDECKQRLQKEASLELLLQEAAAEASWCPKCDVAASGRLCPRCGIALAPGGYVVEAVLAEQPQGRVYLASAPDGALVRISELVFAHVREHSVVDGFEKEVALLRQLSHPAIPRVVDSFREGDDEELRLYAVETHIEGTPLDEYLQDNRVTEAEVRDIADQVLDVLVYLQELSPAIYHRDIRPQNLLRTPGGKIVVRQFAQARDMSVTGVFTLVGHTGYIPAEQHLGIVDKTSDLYGLGATLAHLLTRRAPLPNDPDLDRANVSPQLRAWIERLMAPKPRDRFPTARIARTALHDPVAVPKPRRWMVPAVLSAVAVVSLATAFWASEPAPPPPPSKTAIVNIVPSPADAALFLDGKRMKPGTKRLELEAGRRYRLELRHANFAKWSNDVRLEEGEEVDLSPQLATGDELMVRVVTTGATGAVTVKVLSMRMAVGTDVKIALVADEPRVSVVDERTGACVFDRYDAELNALFFDCAARPSDAKVCPQYVEIEGVKVSVPRTCPDETQSPPKSAPTRSAPTKAVPKKTTPTKRTKTERTRHRRLRAIAGDTTRMSSLEFRAAKVAKEGPMSFLAVDSRPTGLEIQIDGAYVPLDGGGRAKTPALVYGVGPGKLYTVRVRAGDKTSSHTVEGADAGEIAWVDLDLTNPRTIDLPPPPPVDKTGDGCITDPKLPRGFVTVNTRPYSTIYWGDRKIGTTPLSRFPLPSGCVKLKAVTADGRSKTVKIEVSPNHVAIYQFKID